MEELEGNHVTTDIVVPTGTTTVATGDDPLGELGSLSAPATASANTNLETGAYGTADMFTSHCSYF